MTNQDIRNEESDNHKNAILHFSLHLLQPSQGFPSNCKKRSNNLASKCDRLAEQVMSTYPSQQIDILKVECDIEQ